MKRSLVLGCLWAATLVTAGGASAQPAAADAVSWPEALEAAWQRSQERVEASTQVERAEAARTAAGALWAAPPSLELDHRSGQSAPAASSTSAAKPALRTDKTLS